jgi:hypothetical protein
MVLLSACMMWCLAGFSQVFEQTAYPKGYFRNPLNIPISLSGNFGELRPNHYHMGLDLRTNKVENLPVFAAADGYIARIKIEPGGFGRAIYINHPNGFTTLYAHLNNFFPALDKYLKQRQYELESWNVMLELTPDLFPVKKGDFLAYSGNTGGSQAPHLHFEIRRTVDDVNVNPMLFGFPVGDNTAPLISRFAVYDRADLGIHETAAKTIAVKKTGNIFTTSPALIRTNTPQVSFAIGATDTHSGSTNANGIFESVLYHNEEAVVGFRMDQISYNHTRYLNAHIDYRMRSLGGPYYQNLSELQGYLPSIYKKVQNDGVIDISDGEVHKIKIVVKDAYGNASTLVTQVQFDGSLSRQIPAPAGKKFYPLMVDVHETDNAEFVLGESALYDSVHVRYSTTAATSPAAVSDLHVIGAHFIPVHSGVLVRLRPKRNLSTEQRERVVMQRLTGPRTEVQKVLWNGDWALASFREFGSYQLLLDEEPPVITPVGFTDGSDLSRASRIVFTVKDNYNSFRNFRAELDGKWLRFTNDKGRSFIYTFDEKCPRGDHELKVKVQDEAGNVTVKAFRFKR